MVITGFISNFLFNIYADTNERNYYILGILNIKELCKFDFWTSFGINGDLHFVYDIEHNTIANAFDSSLDSLVVLKWLILFAYSAPIILCILDIADWQVLLCWLTIPLAIDLYNSMVDYTVNSESIPEHKWFHFPMEDMRGASNFMIRMYQSRNLTIYYTLLFVLGLVLSYN